MQECSGLTENVSSRCAAMERSRFQWSSFRIGLSGRIEQPISIIRYETPVRPRDRRGEMFRRSGGMDAFREFAGLRPRTGHPDYTSGLRRAESRHLIRGKFLRTDSLARSGKADLPGQWQASVGDGPTREEADQCADDDPAPHQTGHQRTALSAPFGTIRTGRIIYTRMCTFFRMASSTVRPAGRARAQ